MSGFRAKDADRDRYVDIIESAYVDGQLGEQDRELRVGRALTAATLDELDALTRDLQNRPSPVVPAPAPTPAPVPTPVPAPVTAAEPEPWPVKPKDRTPARAVGFVAAAIFAVAVYSMASADPPLQELDYSTVPSDRDGSASVSGYALTAPGVRTFVRRYEAKFQTSEAYEVGILPDRVVARVPVPGRVARAGQWSWDGVWTRPAQTDAVQTDDVGAVAETVDLRRLDVAALFENVESATSGLGVSDAEVQRVVVRPTRDGRGSVTIHVRNSSADRALLETTLDGARIRSVPHGG